MDPRASDHSVGGAGITGAQSACQENYETRATGSFEDTAGSPSRRHPQAWRLLFASWTSQNAHDDAVLVRCAQWRPYQPLRL